MKFISEIPIGKEFRLEKDGPIYTRVIASIKREALASPSSEAFKDKNGAIFTCTPRQMVHPTEFLPNYKELVL